MLQGTPATAPPASVARWQAGGDPALDFFANLARALADFPPPASQRGVFALHSGSAHVKADVEGHLKDLRPAVIEGLRQGYSAAMHMIEGHTRSPSKAAWRYSSRLGRYGDDLMLRAVTAWKGLGALAADVALYLNTEYDRDGQSLRGEHLYRLHFEDGGDLPADAFWSVTLYGEDRYLAANRLDRFALGNRSPLQRDADGGLSLYVSHREPPGPQSNWLPAPHGPFYLILRLYHPQAAQASAILHDEARTWQDRVPQARQLLAEFGGVTTGSFVSQVRKALAQDVQRVHACLTSLKDLAFGGRKGDRGFEQWKAWTALQERSAAEIPEGVQLPEVGAAWHGLVHDLDPRSSLRALETCTMMSLRKSLRRGSVWIDRSLSYRERDQMLISPTHWESQREQHVELLGMPKSPREFLEPLLANLVAGSAAVRDALDRGKVEISADGMLRLPAITALPEKSEPVRVRETVYKLIGNVQFPELLMQLDAATNFSDALLGHRAQTADELVALYGALLAHGTDVDAKGVASMIPGLQPSQISVAMRALEGSGRLRRANERVAQFQSQIPIAALWGDGDKASADMMSLDASRHLWNARVDPRRRTYAAGLYTHVRDRWGIVYDQPIVLNERQAGVAIEGVEANNRSEHLMRLSLVAVDTHGYVVIWTGHLDAGLSTRLSTGDRAALCLSLATEPVGKGVGNPVPVAQ